MIFILRSHPVLYPQILVPYPERVQGTYANGHTAHKQKFVTR